MKSEVDMLKFVECVSAHEVVISSLIIGVRALLCVIVVY